MISLCKNQKKLGFIRDIQREDDVCHGCVNVSPSSKLRRVSLLKHQKGSKQSPRNKQTVDSGKDLQDDYACENESPPTKSRRISLFKRKNTKVDSPNKENSAHKKGPASMGLGAACKELVNLAVRRGSLDDITVMIIDLNHFRCNN